MAEIAEELGAMTPADTSIRRLATLMLAASNPERTMAPAATQEQPPLARLKNLFPLLIVERAVISSPEHLPDPLCAGPRFRPGRLRRRGLEDRLQLLLQ